MAATSEKVNDDSLNKLYEFSGKMAGVCYMPDNYFDDKIQNSEAAIKRAGLTSKSGHHSVFDHGYITFQISRIPKILSMILNSTEQYTTSEKSARYTVMKTDDFDENRIYEKWIKIFEDRISNVYSKIDPKTISKLSLENARYMLSVFTPTYMMWTTSYRQIAYLIKWLDDIALKCKRLQGEFNRRLSIEAQSLSDKFKEVVDSYKHIIENKNRGIEFLHYQNTSRHINNTDYIGDVYQLTYMASFAELAQLQRHRTIHYEMDFTGIDANEYGVYVPKIIAGTTLEDEWLLDFERVSNNYPQCTLVKVLEQGRAIKFFDKCKERLCGRAQLEIMEDTKSTLQRFIENQQNLSLESLNQLNSILHNGEIVSKCSMKGIKCFEKCIWGANQGIDRLI